MSGSPGYGQPGYDPDIAFVEMLAVVPAMARLWAELLSNCVESGMSRTEAVKIVCAYAHGQGGGKIET